MEGKEPITLFDLGTTMIIRTSLSNNICHSWEVGD